MIPKLTRRSHTSRAPGGVAPFKVLFARQLVRAFLVAVVAIGSNAASVAVTADDTLLSGLTAPLPAAANELQEFRVAVAGSDAANFATQTRAELEILVAPMTRQELEGRVEAALEYLRLASTALARVLVQYERLQRREVMDGDLDKELFTRSELIYEFKNELAARAVILIDAAEIKGSDLAEGRTYITAITNVDLPETSAEKRQSADEQSARLAIRRVREDPPVHERPEPWNFSTSQLIEELQPLRQEQLDDRVEAWLQILQKQVRKRIRMDTALGNSKQQSEKEVIARLAAEQQQIVNAIVEKLQAVLAVSAKRGGDTTAASQYIGNATGQRIDLRDPAVFYAQAKAWAISPSGGLQVALNFGKFAAILAAFWLISRIVARVVRAAINRLPNASSLLQDFLVGGSQRMVLLIGMLVAASALGVNITPLAAALGAAGLVIGLALQGTLSNFASGIMILMYRPYDVGDIVKAGGVFGKVEAMTLVSTRILTFDNQVNWVPNNAIWNDVITNATALNTRRVDMVFGIGYGDDLSLAQSIIEKAVSNHPKVLNDPAPNIRVNELGDNSVNFIVRPWASTADYWEVYWDLTRTIKIQFDAAGINIPFPQRDLHLSGPVEVVFKDPNTAS